MQETQSVDKSGTEEEETMTEKRLTKEQNASLQNFETGHSGSKGS